MLDTFSFVCKSLNSWCKNTKCPELFTKGCFDHELINSLDDVNTYREQWKPYLIKDVLSLDWCWNVFTGSVAKVCFKFFKEMGLEGEKVIDIRTCISAASYSWKCFTQFNPSFSIFESKFTRNFMRRSLLGGRTTSYVQNNDVRSLEGQ